MKGVVVFTFIIGALPAYASYWVECAFEAKILEVRSKNEITIEIISSKNYGMGGCFQKGAVKKITLSPLSKEEENKVYNRGDIINLRYTYSGENGADDAVWYEMTNKTN